MGRRKHSLRAQQRWGRMAHWLEKAASGHLDLNPEISGLVLCSGNHRSPASPPVSLEPQFLRCKLGQYSLLWLTLMRSENVGLWISTVWGLRGCYAFSIVAEGRVCRGNPEGWSPEPPLSGGHCLLSTHHLSLRRNQLQGFSLLLPRRPWSPGLGWGLSQGQTG